MQQQNLNRGVADLFGPDLMPATDVNHARTAGLYLRVSR
jgi:hypothetical protein